MLGNPRDRGTRVYYIRPFGWPVIECFFGDQGPRMVEEMGPAAGFAHATDQLIALFGSAMRRSLHPLVASSWSRMTVGGAYSYALPGHAAAREDLARPFEERLFFAGEATHVYDYSTAHGAYDSGLRAAEEAIAALTPVASTNRPNTGRVVRLRAGGRVSNGRRSSRELRPWALAAGSRRKADIADWMADLRSSGRRHSGDPAWCSAPTFLLRKAGSKQTSL